MELRRGASRARGIGLDVDVVGPKQALALMPQASPSRCTVRSGWATTAASTRTRPPTPRRRRPRSRRRDPHAHARDGHPARTAAARCAPSRRRDGPIETEAVVNACGIWAPQVSAMVGAFTPSVPVDHQHIALEAVDGHELPRDMPCFRDTDNLVYGALGGRRRALRRLRARSGRPLGGRRPVGSRRPRAPSGSRALRPADGGGRAAVPVPGGRRRGGARLPPRRDDARRQPAAGPMPGTPGFWMAAGPLAERLRRRRRHRKDDRRVDERPARPSSTHRLPRLAVRRRATGRPPRSRRPAARSTSYYYRLRYPLDTDEWGRPNRLSPLHGRLQDAGAAFGAKNGWERADHFEPGEALAARRAPTSASSAGCGRRGSSTSPRSTRRSASGSA